MSSQSLGELEAGLGMHRDVCEGGRGLRSTVLYRGAEESEIWPGGTLKLGPSPRSG